MFSDGDTVKLHGLKSKRKWNGKTATISGAFNWEKGRYPVRVQTKGTFNEALLKPSNMKLVQKRQRPRIVASEVVKVVMTERKGMGVMALRDIPGGTVIFIDHPLLSIPRGLGDDKDRKNQAVLSQFERIRAVDPQRERFILTYHSQLNSTQKPQETDHDDDDHKEVVSSSKGDAPSLETAALSTATDSKQSESIDSTHSTSKRKRMESVTSTDAVALNSADDVREEDILSVYYTNAFTVSNDSASIESGFFPMIARLNHSCFPNCEVLRFDPRNNSRAVVTLHDVSPGDELTINYIGNSYYTLSMAYAERKEYIKSQFNFACCCHECWPFHSRREGHRAEFGKCQDSIDELVNEYSKRAFNGVLAASEQMIDIVQSAFDGYPTVLSQCYVNAAHALLFLNRHQEALDMLKQTVRIDRSHYASMANLEDVEECLAKIPRKLKADYPWKHVLDLTDAQYNEHVANWF